MEASEPLEIIVFPAVGYYYCYGQVIETADDTTWSSLSARWRLGRTRETIAAAREAAFSEWQAAGTSHYMRRPELHRCWLILNGKPAWEIPVE